jgi:hypothetical protein
MNDLVNIFTYLFLTYSYSISYIQLNKNLLLMKIYFQVNFKTESLVYISKIPFILWNY